MVSKSGSEPSLAAQHLEVEGKKENVEEAKISGPQQQTSGASANVKASIPPQPIPSPKLTHNVFISNLPPPPDVHASAHLPRANLVNTLIGNSANAAIKADNLASTSNGVKYHPSTHQLPPSSTQLPPPIIKKEAETSKSVRFESNAQSLQAKGTHNLRFGPGLSFKNSQDVESHRDGIILRQKALKTNFQNLNILKQNPNANAAKIRTLELQIQRDHTLLKADYNHFQSAEGNYNSSKAPLSPNKNIPENPPLPSASQKKTEQSVSSPSSSVSTHAQSPKDQERLRLQTKAIKLNKAQVGITAKREDINTRKAALENDRQKGPLTNLNVLKEQSLEKETAELNRLESLFGRAKNDFIAEAKAFKSNFPTEKKPSQISLNIAPEVQRLKEEEVLTPMVFSSKEEQRLYEKQFSHKQNLLNSEMEVIEKLQNDIIEGDLFNHDTVSLQNQLKESKANFDEHSKIVQNDRARFANSTIESNPVEMELIDQRQSSSRRVDESVVSNRSITATTSGAKFTSQEALQDRKRESYAIRVGMLKPNQKLSIESDKSGITLKSVNRLFGLASHAGKSVESRAAVEELLNSLPIDASKDANSHKILEFLQTNSWARRVLANNSDLNKTFETRLILLTSNNASGEVQRQIAMAAKHDGKLVPVKNAEGIVTSLRMEPRKNDRSSGTGTSKESKEVVGFLISTLTKDLGVSGEVPEFTPAFITNQTKLNNARTLLSGEWGKAVLKDNKLSVAFENLKGKVEFVNMLVEPKHIDKVKEEAIKLLEDPIQKNFPSSNAEAKEKLENLKLLSKSKVLSSVVKELLPKAVSEIENSLKMNTFITSSELTHKLLEGGHFRQQFITSYRWRMSSEKLFEGIASAITNAHPNDRPQLIHQALAFVDSWASDPDINRTDKNPREWLALQPILEVLKSVNLDENQSELVLKLKQNIAEAKNQPEIIASRETDSAAFEKLQNPIIAAREKPLTEIMQSNFKSASSKSPPPNTLQTQFNNELRAIFSFDKELDQMANDFSSQLTYETSAIYQNIGSEEFEDQAWASGNRLEKSPNIMKLVDKSDRTASHVTSSILSLGEPEERAKAITFYVKVAEKLLEKGDYQNFIAVTTGLNHSSFTRLVRSNEKINPDVKKQLENYISISNPSKNFKALRDIQNQNTKPFLPFIGMIMGDVITGWQNAKNAAANAPNKINTNDFELLHNAYIRPLQIVNLAQFEMPQDSRLQTNINELISQTPLATHIDFYDQASALEPRKATAAPQRESLVQTSAPRARDTVVQSKQTLPNTSPPNLGLRGEENKKDKERIQP